MGYGGLETGALEKLATTGPRLGEAHPNHAFLASGWRRWGPKGTQGEKYETGDWSLESLGMEKS
jgi:hypothetical protein